LPDHIEREAIAACLAHHRPGVPIAFERIPTGKFNDSYFVRAGDEDLVLRVAPDPDATFLFYERDMMRQEPSIHDLLLQETTVPVAPIIVHDASLTILPRDYLLMKRLPGNALSNVERVDADHVLTAVGQCLAQVHALAANAYGYLGEHQPMKPQKTWAEAFAVMWRALLDDIHATGHYNDEERDVLVRLLDAYLPMFDRDVPASLLHMDIWAQNILVNDSGDLTGIVDWDRALWGDPEIEFAVLDYCGISQPAFWEGYGEERDVSDEAQIRHIFYLLYEVQKYIVISHGRGNDPEGARSYKQQTMEIMAQLPKQR
jgi:fructosamine-3-kinase